MENNFKKVKSIIHVVLLGVGLLFWAIMADTCIYRDDFLAFAQFVDSTSAGFLITMFIINVGICCSEELERKTQLTVSYMGGIFYTVSTVFLIMDYAKGKAVRILCGLIFCCALAIMYFAEAIYLTVKKEITATVNENT